MQVSPIVRHRCAFNRAVAFSVRALIEPLERRELLSGSPPRILDARAAYGDAPYAASILAQFDDADLAAADSHTATIDFGDGSGPQAVALQDFGSPALFAEHTYPGAGEWTATLTVVDSEGLSDQRTLLVPSAASRPAPPDPVAPLPDVPGQDGPDEAPGGPLAPDDGGAPASPDAGDTTPPVVTGVYIDGTTWTVELRNHLAAQSQGTKALGYAVPAGAEQLLALPWVNADKVTITFSEAVSVGQGSLAARGVENPLYTGPSTGFSYAYVDSNLDGINDTYAATWTLAAPLPRDRVVLDLGAVSDFSGNALDGEWAPGADAWNPGSGDGTAGGDFRFHINVLPGDANGNGQVDGGDFALVAGNFGTNPRGPRQGDFSGDAYVNGTDFSIFSSNSGKKLPDKPLAPSALSAAPAAGRVDLAWTDNATNEDGFRVERASDAAFTQSLWSTTVAAGTTTYADTTVEPAATYFYRVRAYTTVTTGGDSAPSNTVTAPVPGTLAAPHAPLELTGSALSVTQVRLTWVDVSAVESRFSVERSPRGENAWETLEANVPANAREYVDATGSEATAYDYRVRAHNAAGDSAYSNVATAQTFSAYAMGVIGGTPLGYWRLGEAGGTTAAGDSSGNGRHGAYSGGTAAPAAGAVAQDIDTAATFDGVDDQIVIPDSPALRLTGDLALEAWVYRTEDVPGWVRLIGKGGQNQRNYGLWLEPGASPHLLYQEYDGTNVLNVYSSATLGLNAWHHVAATVEGSTVRVYVDGVLSGSGTRTVAPPTSADPLTIGYAGYDAFFKGRIDEVAVYGRSLTSLQVQAHAEVGGGTLTAPTGLGLSGEAWADGVTFTWQDNAASEEFYLIEWSGPNGWEAIGEAPAGSTSYTDEYPLIGTVNQYRVVAARDGTSELVASAPSNELGVLPKAPPAASYDDNGGANDRGTLSPYATRHDRALTFDVLANDEDYDGGTLSTRVVTQPQNGSVTRNPDNTFTYVPRASFVGTDSFTYVINDGVSDSAPAKAAIDVTNEAPEGHAVPLNFDLRDPAVYGGVTHPGALAGNVSATDADGDSFTYVKVTDPEHGTLDLNAQTGQFLYTANADFAGFDRFAFAATDGIKQGDPTSVVIESTTPIVYANPAIGLPPGYGTTLLPFGADRVVLTSVVPGHDVGHGTLQGVNPAGGGPPYEYYTYTSQQNYTGDDSFQAQAQFGAVASKPVTVQFRMESNVNSTTWWTFPPDYKNVSFRVPNSEASILSPAATGWKPANSQATLTGAQNPQHGTLTFPGNGGFTYTPDPPDPDTGELYYGWDFFSFTIAQPFGATMVQWVQLNVGDYEAPASPRPESEWRPQEFSPTLQGLNQGYQACKALLSQIMTQLQGLGQKVGPVGTASDDAILNRLDEATAYVDPASALYDQYVSQVEQLNRVAGQFLAEQWVVDQADYDVVMAIQGLPLSVGSLTPSRDQMEALAGSLAALGRGADVAVDTANKLVTYAEDTKKVLDGVQMAVGAGALVTTGARLFVQEGIKACAREAARQMVNALASAVAAQVAGYGARLLGLTPEQQYWVKVGLDAFQLFAFMKAARARAQMNGECFVAGTQVVTGLAADGSLITKSIEDISEGDLVLSRDQHDPGDDLDARRVAQVFRSTSDHVRVLTLRGADGNVETIRTTDGHPFYVADDQGWAEASSLAPGVRLTRAAGSDAVVISNVRESHPDGVTVFNLEVEVDHTYFVDDAVGAVEGVWVHNTCDPFQNKINHIFGHNTTRHKLGPLVAAAGSEAKALQAMEVAVTNRVRSGNLADGLYEEVLQVAGVNVTVRFAVVSGAGKVGTAFIV